jgi:hypothetical protein
LDDIPLRKTIPPEERIRQEERMRQNDAEMGRLLKIYEARLTEHDRLMLKKEEQEDEEAEEL